MARIRKVVSEADALWIFTPENNSSYPGHLKNLLDWLSRPVIPLDYGTPTCINGKRVAISGAGGKAATANCRAKLTELLAFIKADVLSEQTGIAVPAEAWGTDILTLTDEKKVQWSAQADALIGKAIRTTAFLQGLSVFYRQATDRRLFVGKGARPQPLRREFVRSSPLRPFLCALSHTKAN